MERTQTPRANCCHRATRKAVAVVVLIVAAVVMTPGSGFAQSGDPSAIPRTAWGTPDLNGVWDFRTVTPLQRPRELAGKETLTEDEALEFEQAFARGRGSGDLSTGPGTGRTAADFELWLDFGNRLTDRRTSLIVDPQDGRMPPRTADGQQRFAARPDSRSGIADGAEGLPVNERCLWVNVPVTVLPSNNYLQLFQTRTHVALIPEFQQDVRIIPLDSQIDPKLPRQWKGLSRGRWEGDSLVVETMHFNGRDTFRGHGPNLHIVERFTRVDAETLNYEYTVDDRDTFTRPWSAMLSMTFSDEPLYEYACHEGNYTVPLILSGARTQERGADAAAR